MPNSPSFKCLCGAFHGGSAHRSLCPDCFKKWKNSIDDLSRLIRLLAMDQKDFPAHLKQTFRDIEKKLVILKTTYKIGS